MYLLISNTQTYKAPEYKIRYHFIEKLPGGDPGGIYQEDKGIKSVNYIVAPNWGTVVHFYEELVFSRRISGWKRIPISNIKSNYFILEIDKESLKFLLDPKFFKFDFKYIGNIFRSKRIPSLISSKKLPKNFNFKVISSEEFIHKLKIKNLIYEEI